jgi:hypothetical protein
MARYARRQVRFTNYVQRLPYDDEFYVMQSFSRHIASCQTCVAPIDPHVSLFLCQKAYLYAQDVYRYIRLENGKVVSNLEPRSSSTQTEIEVPPKFAIIWRLLSQARGTPVTHSESAWEPKQSTKNCTSKSRRKVEISSARNQKAYLHSDPYDDGDDFITISATIPTVSIPLRIKRSDLKWLYKS